MDGRLFKYPDQTNHDDRRSAARDRDVLGDWREEIITSLPGELRVYTASTPSPWRRPWLMDDRMYRLGARRGVDGVLPRAAAQHGAAAVGELVQEWSNSWTACSLMNVPALA